MITSIYKNENELSLVMNARQVADLIGISIANAYALFRREDFPCIKIGTRRKCVKRDKLFEWLDKQSESEFDKEYRRA